VQVLLYIPKRNTNILKKNYFIGRLSKKMQKVHYNPLLKNLFSEQRGESSLKDPLMLSLAWYVAVTGNTF
jgi:hypothetical protein